MTSCESQVGYTLGLASRLCCLNILWLFKEHLRLLILWKTLKLYIDLVQNFVLSTNPLVGGILQMPSCANLALKELMLNYKSLWDLVVPVTAGSCR